MLPAAPSATGPQNQKRRRTFAVPAAFVRNLFWGQSIDCLPLGTPQALSANGTCNRRHMSPVSDQAVIIRSIFTMRRVLSSVVERLFLRPFRKMPL